MSKQITTKELYKNIKQITQSCSQNNGSKTIAIEDDGYIQINKSVKGNAKPFDVIQNIIGKSSRKIERATYSKHTVYMYNVGIVERFLAKQDVKKLI